MAGRLVPKKESALCKAIQGKNPTQVIVDEVPLTNAQKYPRYFRDVSELDSVDTYAINKLYPVDDPSGAILHARKKLLIPGDRTGGKTMYQDIKEARDTLNRWLEINQE